MGNSKGIVPTGADKPEFSIIDENLLKSRIYTIRGVKVILDADLAEIYGYSTKAFNRQVKNNIEKFDSDFRFALNPAEIANLRCNFCTSSWGGQRYAPFALTEQGIYMLMTVLKGERAIAQSEALRAKMAATRLRRLCKSNARRCTTPLWRN